MGQLQNSAWDTLLGAQQDANNVDSDLSDLEAGQNQAEQEQRRELLAKKAEKEANIQRLQGEIAQTRQELADLRDELARKVLAMASVEEIQRLDNAIGLRESKLERLESDLRDERAELEAIIDALD